MSGNVAMVESGIYLALQAPPGKPSTLAFYSFATGEVETVFEYESLPFIGLSVAPDGRSIIYSEAPEPQADIMLVEDFE